MDLVARLATAAAAHERPIYCVGGCIRDRLLGRPSADIDLATVDAVVLARSFAKEQRAFFVPLDEGRGTARVIARDRSGQLDFAELQGDLATDLGLRDFTINAIACTLPDWLQAQPAWLDPHDGQGDLARGIVRVVGPNSLADDPLRVLRAWRFAAALGFAVESATRARISTAAAHLPEVAAERIRVEWLALLAADGAIEAVNGLAADGVLAQLVPGARPERLGQLEAALRIVHGRVPGFVAEPERLALLRFAALLPSGAEELAARFALSRLERRALAAWTAPLPPAGEPCARREWLARLLLERGEEAVGALALKLPAEHLAATLEPLASELLPAFREPPLLTGDDLRAAGHRPGPSFRAALEAVRLAQLVGRTRSRDEALEIAGKVLSQHG